MPGYPYSWWGSFQQNYSALQQLKQSADKSYQPAIAALLRSGQTIQSQVQSGVTVSNDDAMQWLYTAHQLAERMHNDAFEQSTQSGLDYGQNENWLSDAGSYWQPELQTIASGLQTVGNAFGGLTELATVLIIGVAAIVILPPLLQAIGGRK